ncbi:putative nucleic-acid-binding protein [Sphingomonas jinjuensis]|uniref:Putative nucleic-acid-binding protein n=1 Tax=Sphingomonas jinjuensis TaxID=535907 RepID=A0A840F813_9SPHN|nr:type II toxin-antitoxin system VapC family toxin [Sphingomonas jinjuensis]MBB4153869.1 putative nucleic-acid-binding protein [Sphingomonas jinjuensis]
MRAVDTNILVRWITRDDDRRSLVADTVMREPVMISLTVLIELVWVLGGRKYGLARGAIVEILREVMKTDTITIERHAGVSWCVDRYAQGADFADMIHLIAARGATGFVTFEYDLADDAGVASPLPIETLA